MSKCIVLFIFGCLHLRPNVLDFAPFFYFHYIYMYILFSFLRTCEVHPTPDFKMTKEEAATEETKTETKLEAAPEAP